MIPTCPQPGLMGSSRQTSCLLASRGQVCKGSRAIFRAVQNWETSREASWNHPTVKAEKRRVRLENEHDTNHDPNTGISQSPFTEPKCWGDPVLKLMPGWPGCFVWLLKLLLPGDQISAPTKASQQIWMSSDVS